MSCPKKEKIKRLAKKMKKYKEIKKPYGLATYIIKKRK